MSTLDRCIRSYRKPAYSIHPLLLKRWSPRAMSGEKLTDDKLITFFEAGLTVEPMIAMGKPSNIDILSEYNQGLEFPSGRKPLTDLIQEGHFINTHLPEV